MLQTVKKITVLTALMLLTTGRSLAMKKTIGKVLKFCGENKKNFIGVVGGLGAASYYSFQLIKGSGTPKEKKSTNEVVLKNGEIAVSEEIVRKKLGLGPTDPLPEDILNELKNGGFQKGFDEGKKQGEKPYTEKLKELYSDGKVPNNWAEQSQGDSTAIAKFFEKNRHPGYQNGQDAKHGTKALEALKKRSNELGIKIAKKVFNDKTKDIPKDGLFETYLKSQLKLYEAIQKNELESLKLAVVKLFYKDYTEAVPTDLCKWIAQNVIEKNTQDK